jgi:hypothetical protein
MAGQTDCPRCGARDSFIKGYLPETCVCRVCQSQLDWREIPGCGPDCTPATAPSNERPGETPGERPGGALGDSLDNGRWDV